MTGRGVRWVGLVVVAATLVVGMVLATRFGRDPGQVDSPLLGKPAPSFNLPTLTGDDSVTLEDLKGDIVVLNFFASWCPPCRLEHDDLVATSDAYADRGVTFVQVAYQEDPTQTIDYLSRAGAAEATLYLSDSGSRTAIAYGVFGIPETFFIDRSGVVVGKLIGEADVLALGAAIDAILRGDELGQQVTGDTQQSPDQ